MHTGTAVCGSPTHTNFTLCVKFFKNSSDKLVTAGNYNLHVWEYDKPNNKLRPQEAQLGQLQRIFKTICIDSYDKFAYCGTSTGDILQVALDRVLFKNSGPSKAPMQLGAVATCEVPTGDLLVGGGDGSLVVLKTAMEVSATNPKLLKKMGILASTKLEGAITSIYLEGISGKACSFFVGTAGHNMYRVTYDTATSK